MYILVHLNQSTDCDARLLYAIELAVQTDAFLTGLYSYPKLPIPSLFLTEQIPIGYFNQYIEEHEIEAQEVKKKFSSQLRSAGLSGEWNSTGLEILKSFDAYAQYSSYLVLGKDSAKCQNGYLEFPDQILLTECWQHAGAFDAQALRPGPTVLQKRKVLAGNRLRRREGL